MTDFTLDGNEPPPVCICAPIGVYPWVCEPCGGSVEHETDHCAKCEGEG